MCIRDSTTNVPLDRVLQKYQNVQGAMAEEAEWWQTLAMLGGWPQWQIMPDKKKSSKKTKTKEVKSSIGFAP